MAGSETITLDAFWATGPSGIAGPATCSRGVPLKYAWRASQLLPFGYQHAVATAKSR